MLAARADDIRTQRPFESHPAWHYIDFPFKPEGEPLTVQSIQLPQDNILSAITQNQRIALNGSGSEKRAIALTWLFHLFANVHQPLHDVQLFTREYPNGDRGGGDFCIRVAQDRTSLSLHRPWDGRITSSYNVERYAT